MSKVYFLNNVYPTEECPQMGSYAKTMADDLSAAGHDVTVDAVFYHKSSVGAKDKAAAYAAFWPRLLRVNLSDYDIVYINHFTYCFPVLFNPTLKKSGKVYIHWHGKELVASSAFNRRLVKLLGKRLAGMRHIAPSLFFKKKILAAVPVETDSVAVSPSGGIDTGLFCPSDTESGADCLVIGFPGEIKTTKGADVLLEIMGMHEEIRRATGRAPLFRFISYGPELEAYIPRFKSTGARFEVLPKIPKNEMPGFFRPLDIALVLSSAVIGESLGLVALEAMSCGVPVIAHDICAFPEFILSGVSGELTPYSDSPQTRAREVFDKIVIVASRRDSYSPRKVVESDYSRESVIDFYKTL